MCGISGYWRWQHKAPQQELLNIVWLMSRAIAHRGPDADGHWADAALGLAFGHRRLSILDVSSAGAQPMLSPDGKAVLVLNGEIYNFGELQRELESQSLAPRWRGHSDTEVLLAALRAYGIEKTLSKIQGMFAFAYADLAEKKLFLARDRFGEKPLYVYQDDSSLAFASELKAIRQVPGFDGTLCRDAMAEYLAYAYVPGSRAIYARVQKILPGHFAVLNLASEIPPNLVQISYWSAQESAQLARRHPIFDERVVEKKLEDLLRQSVQSRMVSDVPLGAFLSGGIDSSMIVAMMQQGRTQKIKTYSIGFQEMEYNEAHHARAVAHHLGTDHHEHIVTADEAMAVIPQLSQMYDEPFADSSQIPTFLVSQLARRDVTVALSGDAGDELFGGYNRYRLAPRIWKILRPLPLSFRRAVMTAITRIAPNTLDAAVFALGVLLPKLRQQKLWGDKIHKLADLFDAADEHRLYQRLLSFCPLQWVYGASHAHDQAIDSMGNFLDDMMLHDTLNYLPGDILTKVDRASMAVGLEARVPFLDTELYAFAWSLPQEMKICHNKGKHLLRQVLYRYVPRTLIDRPKMGFGVPIADWLRGPLRPWAEDLLAHNKLTDGEYLNAVAIRQKWDEHQSGSRNWHQQLWAVLMLQAWRNP